VVHACNPSTQEAKAGGSRVWGQPELYSETLSQEQSRTNAYVCVYLYTYMNILQTKYLLFILEFVYLFLTIFTC
jgi:hypothetical protein